MFYSPCPRPSTSREEKDNEYIGDDRKMGQNKRSRGEEEDKGIENWENEFSWSTALRIAHVAQN